MGQKQKLSEAQQKDVFEEVTKNGKTLRDAAAYLQQKYNVTVSKDTVADVVSRHRGELMLGAQIEQTRNVVNPQTEMEFSRELERLERACKLHEEYIEFWTDLARTQGQSADMSMKFQSQLCRKEARENWVALARCIDIIANIKMSKETRTVTKGYSGGPINADDYKRGFAAGVEDSKKMFDQKCRSCRALSAPRAEETADDKESGNGDSTPG